MKGDGLKPAEAEFQNVRNSDRVLIVDDEEFMRTLLSRFVEAEGYPHAAAASGEEAWKMLERGSYSLVLSDVRMPGISGIDLLTKIKQQFGDYVAVVMITAVDDRRTGIDALRKGAYGYLIKPFDRAEVAINIANALERRRLTLAGKHYEIFLETEVRQRTADVHRREEEIAMRLLSASEYRDEETGTHIRRIGLYAEALARNWGMEDGTTDMLRIAAAMHDIGKIGVPDRILRKPAPLTAQEFEEVKKHTTVGASILDNSEVPMLALARDIALTHHERWDGSGYPAGLSGEDIPVVARLVALADVYDALVHSRVYRPPMPEDEALEIMESERGSHFAPDAHDCFVRTLPELRDIRRKVREKH